MNIFHLDNRIVRNQKISMLQLAIPSIFLFRGQIRHLGQIRYQRCLDQTSHQCTQFFLVGGTRHEHIPHFRPGLSDPAKIMMKIFIF